MKIVCRPGTVKPYTYINDYHLEALVALIRVFDLRHCDWVLTHHDDEYIRSNWMRLFTTSAAIRSDIDTDSTYPERIAEFKYNDIMRLLLKHGGSPHRVEKYEGVRKNTVYNIIGLDKIRKVKQVFKEKREHEYV